MVLERCLTLLSSVGMALGLICCGMEAVGTGEPGAGASGSSNHPAPVDARAPSLGDATTDAARDAPTEILVVTTAAPDAGALATCRPKDATCSVDTDCCPGLECKEDDEQRHCK